PVERKNIRQWMLKITAYADELLKGLDDLDWPESVKLMQRNWIGKSTGAEVRFAVDGSEKSIVVYTTRPDTLFGATYMVLAPEHPMVTEITTPEQKADVEAYREQASKKSDLERTDLAKDKTGVFTGAYAVNPVNGVKIPVWISDYVLISYGTGAIMAVPAHDERDWEFAKKFGLPVIRTVTSEAEWEKNGPDGDYSAPPAECTPADGRTVNSGRFNGLPTKECIVKMTEWLEETGVGKKTVNYKLRDWIFSRQRYWGEPIPLVHCETCGIVPLDEKDLPLRLPQVDSYQPSGTGESPLAGISSWVECTCPKCGGKARRETNTMPQWAGSCWYYLRYLDPHNQNALAAREKIDYWMPVDLYVGGAEHAVLHLLYSRFWHKVLYDLGLVNTKEPFQRLVNQGMITSFAFQRKNKTLVPADEVEEVPGHTNEFVEKATGEKLERVVAKMSKSLKNVINPDDIIREYGADSCRMYEMFMGPLEMSKPWSTQGLIGVHRFLERVWNLSEKPMTDESASGDTPLNRLLHKTIKKVTEDTRTLNFNTAISQMMIFINELAKAGSFSKNVWENFIKLLAPYAPHLGEELWQKAGHSRTVSLEAWPSYEQALCADSKRTVVVQVNGKVRDKFEAETGTPDGELKTRAMETEGAKKFTDGKSPKKIIVVQGKLVNIVV
ncbi:MAG: leucine--tRNA ligase, partial [Spirochaetes bacterium]|nr:leucine--tRNA ligase [Candidatus Avitreponema avistercoris]